MIKIVIDNRENKLIELLEKNNINITKKNLEIGDIIILSDEKPIIIIERKTLSDLSASIKDGRYKEQKIRLIHNYKDCKKIYLIENSGHFDLGNSILMSTKINGILRDNISVLESSSLINTYEILMKIVNNIPKYLDILLNNKNNDESYVSCIQINKKANLNKENIEILQLSVIPGISKNIAKVILNHFGSIREIYKLLDIKDKNEFIKEISELKNGKRKLGKKLSEKFVDFIF